MLKPFKRAFSTCFCATHVSCRIHCSDSLPMYEVLMFSRQETNKQKDEALFQEEMGEELEERR